MSDASTGDKLMDLLDRWEEQARKAAGAEDADESLLARMELDLYPVVRGCIVMGDLPAAVYLAVMLGNHHGVRTHLSQIPWTDAIDEYVPAWDPEARRWRQEKKRLRALKGNRKGSSKVAPDAIAQAIRAHHRYGQPRQWTSVTNEVGAKMTPRVSGKQVRRLVPELQW
jgi:hypothetical protein